LEVRENFHGYTVQRLQTIFKIRSTECLDRVSRPAERLSWAFSRLFSVPPGKCCDNTSKWPMTACFHMLSGS